MKKLHLFSDNNLIKLSHFIVLILLFSERCSVLKNISGSVIAIVAPLGAHHIDLRPATKEDPDWLVGLRESELEIISGWLSDYYGEIGPLFQRAAAKGSAAS